LFLPDLVSNFNSVTDHASARANGLQVHSRMIAALHDGLFVIGGLVRISHVFIMHQHQSREWPKIRP
jgi:hypothetical protein